MEKRVLKVTVLVEVEVDEDMDLAEQGRVIRDAGAAAELGLLSEENRVYLGNVHGTASAAEWVVSGFRPGEYMDFYSASRAEGFPV
jgi:hypothetical protein